MEDSRGEELRGEFQSGSTPQRHSQSVCGPNQTGIRTPKCLEATEREREREGERELLRPLASAPLRLEGPGTDVVHGTCAAPARAERGKDLGGPDPLSHMSHGWPNSKDLDGRMFGILKLAPVWFHPMLCSEWDRRDAQIPDPLHAIERDLISKGRVMSM